MDRWLSSAHDKQVRSWPDGGLNGGARPTSSPASAAALHKIRTRHKLVKAVGFRRAYDKHSGKRNRQSKSSFATKHVLHLPHLMELYHLPSFTAMTKSLLPRCGGGCSASFNSKTPEAVVKDLRQLPEPRLLVGLARKVAGLERVFRHVVQSDLRPFPALAHARP